MPRDARVAVERHLAEVAADVGPADADPVDPDQGFARPRVGRLGNGDGAEPAGLFELNGVHAGLAASWRCSTAQPCHHKGTKITQRTTEFLLCGPSCDLCAFVVNALNIPRSGTPRPQPRTWPR